VLIWSSKSAPQAWHLDSPFPNVFVNLVYLDDGQMTQFMVPAALSSTILGMKAPVREHFGPGGLVCKDPGGGSIPVDSQSTEISENWQNYLEKR